ncbi:MAG: pilus assembly protein, partial [Gammaproteobacteria bacterium]|nr:pilus assembly protein [Gammaproteobacteria bacterium]
MNTIRLHSKQRGAIVPIVVIGLLAMLAVAGLAMDGSHALANKTRAQNTVDASALAAAKVLDDTDGDTALATAAANSLFSINADAAGNHELNSAYDAGDITVTVQYSATLNPFVPGSFVPGTTSWFVRVIATGFDTETTLTKVLGVNEIATPATAVAGPSGP